MEKEITQFESIEQPAVLASGEKSEEMKNKARARLFELFERDGILENIDENIVIDLKKFTDKDFLSSINDITLAGGDGRIRARKSEIYDLLSAEKVISKEDYERSVENKEEAAGKNLFNEPKSIEDAFSGTEKQDYYLNFWDLFQDTKMVWSQKIKAKNGEEISVKELYLYTKLYKEHKARRNKNGILEVFDDRRNEYITAGSEWIYENIGSMGEPVNFSGKGFQKFLIDNCPNLLDKGLIKLDDSRINTSSSSGELVRKEFTLKENQPEIMINGVKYYIGRKHIAYMGEKIPKENVKVVILDKNTAGIVSTHKNEERLIFTFDLLTDEEKEAKRNDVKKRYSEKNGKDIKEKQVTALINVNKSEVEERMNKWSAVADNPKRKDETDAEYGERMSRLGSFSYIRDIGNDFSRYCQIGIHNLDWQEQQWLISACYELAIKDKYDKFLEFGKNYGLKGLKAFLSVEFSAENGHKIIQIGESLEPDQADLLFTKIAELTDVAGMNAEKLKKEFYKDESNVGMDAFRLELLGKAHEIICEFSDGLLKKNKDRKVAIDSLLRKLSNNRVEMDLFCSVLRAAKMNGEKIDLENIKGLSLGRVIIDKKTGSILTEKEKEQALKIVRDNYTEIFADNPDAYKRVIGEFESEFGNTEGQSVYMLKYKDELIASCRFTPLSENEVYGGSFNVVKDAQNFSIGNYFLHAVRSDVLKDFDIRIKSRIDNLANESYKRIGFEIIGTRKEKDGTEYYEMVMSGQREQLEEAA